MKQLICLLLVLAGAILLVVALKLRAKPYRQKRQKLTLFETRQRELERQSQDKKKRELLKDIFFGVSISLFILGALVSFVLWRM